MVQVEVGSGVRVAVDAAKLDIWRGPFAVFPQVNGAYSCSEGGSPPVKETSRG